MGELKPIGSEKLSGDAKIQRILELTYYQSENSSKKAAEVVKESKTGVYGVVKEKDGYYVKKGLNENSLDYIGGLFMKNKNKYNSYGEALKKLEFLTEQEEIQEATKYVLKQNKPSAPAPQAEAPAPMPTTDPAAPAAAPDPTALDAPDGDPSLEPEDPNASPEDPNDYMKVIQKMTGKLTQKLGAYKDKLESNDIKYVINMVLGALDLDKLDDADETEILDKFDEEPNPEEGGMPGGEEGSAPVPPSEDDLGETQVDGMDALEELINTPFDDDYSVFDDEEDEIPSPDIRDFEDKRASKYAEKDFAKDNPEGDEEEDLVDPEMITTDYEDEEDPESPLDMSLKGDEETDDEMTSNDEPLLEVPGEEADQTKEIDIEELTSMVNNSVKDSLSKYFS